MKSVRNTTLILALIFIAKLSYAQCTESNMMSSTDNTQSSFGQSITAACDGNLSQFTFSHFATSNTIIGVSVYEGQGCGGTEVYSNSDNIPGNNIDEATTINFDPTIPVTSGQQYTILITTDNGIRILIDDGGNNYPGGGFHGFNCDLQNDNDMVFSYTIDELVAIPTLSQWMIIILGLILTITGMAVVLQKKNLSIIRN
jgi:hypothetical protein